MNKVNILIIGIGIVILLLLILLFFINNLFLKKQKVDFQFKNVINYLNERVELFEKIIKFLEENTETEKKYMTNIKNNIIVLNEIKNSTEENFKEIKNSYKLLQKFITLAEVYPNFKKKKEYNSLVEEINLNIGRFIYAIESYNNEAINYNEFKQSKFNSVLSKIFKIKDYEYYNK